MSSQVLGNLILKAQFTPTYLLVQYQAPDSLVWLLMRFRFWYLQTLLISNLNYDTVCEASSSCCCSSYVLGREDKIGSVLMYFVYLVSP